MGLVLLINLIKYPFLLVGTRFTAATGLSLLEGYQQQAGWYLPVFLLITAATGVANIAAVAAVSGSLATSLLPAALAASLSPTILAVLLLAFCLVQLLWGHYRSLDRFSKLVVALLVVSTTAAAVATLLKGPASGAPLGAMFTPSPWTLSALPFLIALMGWMPCPLDLAAWSSLWIFARREDSGHLSTRAEAEADFNIGYIATVVMAVLFVILGAWVMHGTGRSFSPSGAVFAQQLIELYTASLGRWAYPLIAVAAFTTMFSTAITCLDGYPRSASAGVRLLQGFQGREVQDTGEQSLWIVLHALAAAGVMLFSSQSMGALVQLAMVVSFVTTPLLGWMNLRVMQGRQVSPANRMGPVLLTISQVGLVFLSGFVVLFGLSVWLS